MDFYGKKKMRRLKDNKGESLIETLVSVLIMSLGFTMLAGAIVSSAKVNATAKKMTTMAQETLNEDDWSVSREYNSVGTLKVIVNGDELNPVTVNVYRYGEAGKGVYVFK